MDIEAGGRPGVFWIYCHKCGNSDQLEENSMREALQQAKKIGWAKDDVTKKTLCPMCHGFSGIVKTFLWKNFGYCKLFKLIEKIERKK
jgi:hypothetical protein